MYMIHLCMRYKNLIIIFILLFSTFVYAEKLHFIPRTVIVLPETSLVKIKWILVPGDKDRPPDVSSENIQFVVDYKNNPLIAYSGKLLFNPLSGYIVKLNQPFKEMICLDNGVLIFSDGRAVYYIDNEKLQKTDIPQASLKQIATLPFNDGRIFKGSGNSLYAVARNSKTGKYEIFLFNPLRKNFNRILVSNKPVNALTGTGSHLFLATGRQIEEFLNDKRRLFYEHPREDILELFYSNEAGVFYKTSHGIGFVKDGNSLEFLQSDNPEVFLKGASMFVFFSNAMAVLEFVNLDDLKNYSFKVLKIVDINKTF